MPHKHISRAKSDLRDGGNIATRKPVAAAAPVVAAMTTKVGKHVRLIQLSVTFLLEKLLLIAGSRVETVKTTEAETPCPVSLIVKCGTFWMAKRSVQNCCII